nr:reverse transcriptase domain-containing protein [Tanacetum cinerariifolium]
MQNQLANLTDMVSKLLNSNTASSSGSGTLPGNTITNPKEDLKGITTQSGVAYQGPIIPTPFKQGTEVTKDQVQTPSSQSTAPVQPPVIRSETQTPVSEPVVAPVSVPMPNLKPSISNEAITYNLDQTSRYSANYNQMTANKIDVIYEMYSQEVLGFFDVTASGSPTLYDDPIVSTTSPTLTPFGDSDFLLFEEAYAFLGLEDDPNSPEFDPSYYDPEGDILLLEAILNNETLPPLPNHDQYLPSFKKELKVELKDLPPHLEYIFLEGDNKLPVIIAKELGDEGKSALIKVLKSHKRAIAWKLSDIQGINPEFCTHKILWKRTTNQRPWVSPIHCVPKKGGFTVVENEENELIPTRLVTGWR